MAVKNPLWFWGAFLLFFALIFAVGVPVMMYGQASYPVPLEARIAPAWALTMLAVSVGLWLGLLYVYMDTLVLAGVRSVRRMHDILTRGEPRNALIEQVVCLPGGVDGFPQLRLRLAFDNLSGTPITDELVLLDSKPMQRRYEVGRTLPARLSRSPGPYPNMSLEGGTPENNHSTLWLRASIGVLFVAVVASAYGVAWHLQNDGLGWTFFKPWASAADLSAGAVGVRRWHTTVDAPAASGCGGQCAEVSRRGRRCHHRRRTADRCVFQRTAAGGVPAAVYRCGRTAAARGDPALRAVD